MSEQNKVSPLLDGFLIGDPMSDHNGIQCCPAMRENTEEKYIVKIISVPASQKQLDALLLTGAYPDAASATDYFKEVADGIVKEAELLKQLSKLEGFLSYDNWQTVPMAGSRLGYQVYLISPYRRSLEKYLQRHCMTHLGAVNLGLDLCAALSICRRAGFMHIDLQPANIFMTSKREFRIGDLGFAKLSNLKFTSLPEKYCSSYTPPELRDPLNTLNPTADIYAIGMILYRIYNNGVLPSAEQVSAAELPAPLNADYEMAEIILKACDPNPRKRHQTPIELGQALVGYMQRNSPADTPIVPPAVGSDLSDSSEDAEAANSEAPMQVRDLSFMESSADETAPELSDAEDLADVTLTEDISSMLAQADALLTEPAQEPESIAEPAPEATEEPEPAAEQVVLPAEAASSPIAVAEEPKTAQPEFDAAALEEGSRKKRSLWKPLLAVVLLAALALGAFWFYQNEYLIYIGTLDIRKHEDTVTVMIDTESPDGLLYVTCIDSYGNSFEAPVAQGQAQFTGLKSGTTYIITLQVNGFHGLSGSTSGTVTTAKKTEILDFSAINGNEDGTVILNFSFEGPEQDWIVEYSAEGEAVQTVSFTGQTVTVSGLTLGKTYTFALVSAPGSDFFITGQDTLEIAVLKNVIAENLAIVSCENGVLTAKWELPADAQTENWTVRCYSDNGYDETVTVTETSVQFENIVTDSAYTLEVTAAGMTQGARTYITANPATVTDIAVEETVDGKLKLTWESGGTVPEGSWQVLYTVDSGDLTTVVVSSENSAVIEPAIPGAVYHLSIQPADGATVFGGQYSHTTAAAEVFNSKSINGADVTGSFCPTPAKTGWTYKDIADNDYTATYAPGSKVSMVLYSPKRADGSAEEIFVMFVIRDEQGNPLPNLTSVVTAYWNGMWNNRTRYCSLDLPVIPAAAGKYTVEVYFNRQLVITKNLTVTE